MSVLLRPALRPSLRSIRYGCERKAGAPIHIPCAVLAALAGSRPLRRRFCGRAASLTTLRPRTHSRNTKRCVSVPLRCSKLAVLPAPVAQTGPRPRPLRSMKLDVNVLRYLAKEDFRVLTSVEMGQKNVSGGRAAPARRQRAAPPPAAPAAAAPPARLCRSRPRTPPLAIHSTSWCLPC